MFGIDRCPANTG